jgi:hypothetical protein
MFSTSMTSGAMATTRGSAAAVVQVVQPRFEAPPTTKVSTLMRPAASLEQKAVTVSMARTAALVMGRRISHSGPAPSRKSRQP